MKSTMKKQMVSQKGTTINAGESVDVTKHPNRDSYIRVKTSDGRAIVCMAYSAHEKLTGFKSPPSMKTLEKWVSDSVAKSITGKRVEPDGYDTHGFPSWLLVIGLI